MRTHFLLLLLFLSTASAQDIILEAEDAALNGVSLTNIRPGFSGRGYVTGFDNDEDSVTISFIVPEAGHYTLSLIAAVETGWGSKVNDILVNGQSSGSVTTEDKAVFYEHPTVKVWLGKGKNTVIVKKNWGWFDLDAVVLRPAAAKAPDKIKASLITPKPHPNAVRLMRYLADQYGVSVLSGQQKHYEKDSLKAVRDATGKDPAILGLDMIDYSPSRVEHGASSTAVEDAIAWWQKGGIVTFCWHWNAPMHLIDQAPDRLWWSGFYTKATTFDLAQALKNKKSPEYKALLRDIDAIAVQLKKLQTAGVPILWRPLHEASGGWFWWGAKGSGPYLELYKLLFDRLTKRHKLNNLIWVWNAQNLSWYPGDEFVDIIGEDVYAADHSHASEIGRFDAARTYSPTGKIIALSENGPLPDPDLMKRDGAWWSWFVTWGGFIEDEAKTTDEMKNRVFNHPLVITLDELPDLKNYPLKD